MRRLDATETRSSAQPCVSRSPVPGSLPPAPAPPPGAVAAPLSNPTLSGGVSGLDMNVKVTFSSCGDCQDGLEAIQVAWATGGPQRVGKQQTMFPPFAATYDAFVDGGKNSPGGATYTGDHPYYIGRSGLPASYGYQAAQGSAGSVTGCTANPTDRPTAALSWDQAFFETAIVCLKNKGGSDRILNSFSWGFVKKGTVFQADVWSGGTKTIGTHSTPTNEFLSILRADYPGYSFTT